MNRITKGARAGLGLCAVMAGAALLCGCGRQASLEQPAPLFGAHAKAEYRQRQEEAQARRDQQRANQQNDVGSADRADRQPPGADDAPRTTRDIKDPNQQLTPLSANPLPGTQSDPFGPQPSQTPPVR